VPDEGGPVHIGWDLFTLGDKVEKKVYFDDGVE
jgi:hypothetical protein